MDRDDRARTGSRDHEHGDAGQDGGDHDRRHQDAQPADQGLSRLDVRQIVERGQRRLNAVAHHELLAGQHPREDEADRLDNDDAGHQMLPAPMNTDRMLTPASATATIEIALPEPFSRVLRCRTTRS